MYINFSDIPGSQNLFLDYLYEFENVQHLYKKNFRDKENYPGLFEELKNKPRPQREKAAEIIKKQYQGLKPSKITELNLQALSSEKTIAVVTGQQLGLLGGPLYTIYKTITAIKLSSYLKSVYEDYNFVPVFWLEGDDHDFDEIRSLKIYGEDNTLKTVSYNDNLSEDAVRGSVGEMILEENIEKVFDELRNLLRDTEFKDEILSLFQNYYCEGESLKFAFKQLIFKLFDDYGLIIFDPQDKNIKQLLVPVFKNEIENFRSHSQVAIERSALLDESYHAQIKLKPINLFLSDNEGRFSIEPDENDFKLKNRRVKFSKDELLKIIEESPEKISPNVMLRPICQDYILPTGFYIGGPAEISYFAQVIPNYELFGLVQPIIYPRASATIVEKNIAGILPKYELSYNDIFHEEQTLTSKVLSKLTDNSVNQLFEGFSETLEKELGAIKKQLIEIDKNLDEAVEKTKQNIVFGMNKLKDRTLKAQETKHNVAMKQIEKIKLYLHPDSNLQERELNLIYFLNKYNFDILQIIFNEVSINKFEHQMIEI